MLNIIDRKKSGEILSKIKKTDKHCFCAVALNTASALNLKASIFYGRKKAVEKSQVAA